MLLFKLPTLPTSVAMAKKIWVFEYKVSFKKTGIGILEETCPKFLHMARSFYVGLI